MKRSSVIQIISIIILYTFIPNATYASNHELSVKALLQSIEQDAGGRLGVSATDTETKKSIQYRSDERFPFCSTFKVLLVSTVLKISETDEFLLKKHIFFKKKDIVSWAPITEQHLLKGMSIAELCAAALQYSDNTATNLLLYEIGGPSAVTTFARSIHDGTFNLDRWEPDLNTAVPGDKRDTTTPAAMESSLHELVLGNTLKSKQKELLQNWLKKNTTGDKSIRAGVPSGWVVADKTGSGAYGTTNDIAVIWPPSGKPLVLAIYFTQYARNAPARPDILARVTRLIIGHFKGPTSKES